MKLRIVTDQDVLDLKRAHYALTNARNLARAAGAKNAQAAIARAMKSTEGALRHARRCYHTQNPEAR